MDKPRFPVAFFRAAALAAATAVFWACAHEHGTPTVKIVQPANGSTVAGPDVLLRVTTQDFWAAAKLTESEAAHGGHIHVFLDKPIGADADATASLDDGRDTVTLKGLTPGHHTVIVQGAGADHKPIAGMVDTSHFNVSP